METQTKKTTVKLVHFFHKDAKQIRLDFFYDPQIVDDVKEINGIKWSKENKCWYIFNNKENLKSIFDSLKGKVSIDAKEFFRKKDKKVNDKAPLYLPEIKPEPNYAEIIDQYILALEAKGYSKSTIKAHKTTITNFLDFVKNRETKEVVNSY